jgi:hypothetical protein
MQTWEQVLAHIEAALDTYEMTLVSGLEGVEFALPATMPVPPAYLATRIENVQVRLAALTFEHEREMAQLRTSLAAASRTTAGETGSLIDERA